MLSCAACSLYCAVSDQEMAIWRREIYESMPTYPCAGKASPLERDAKSRISIRSAFYNWRSVSLSVASTDLDFERRRQIAHYESTAEPLRQETRGLNEMTGETYALRSKEEAEDYRYMPDANLPALIIDEVSRDIDGGQWQAHLGKLRDYVPEMPWKTVDRLSSQYGLAPRDVETLIGLDEYEAAGVRYFEEVANNDTSVGKRACNWLVAHPSSLIVRIAHELLGQLGKAGRSWTPDVVPPSVMRELVIAIEDGRITGELLRVMFLTEGTTGKAIIRHAISLAPSSVLPPLEKLLDALGLKPFSSDDLRVLCEQAISRLPKEAELVRKGNEKVAMRIVGEVMKMSKGRADAKAATQIILGILSA